MVKSEKRSLTRFGLQVPALIMASDPARQLEKVCLLSRDLSGFGGFFISKEYLSLDALVDIRLILDFSTSCVSESDRYSVIEVEGVILRKEATGIAIKFNGGFRISPIPGV